VAVSTYTDTDQPVTANRYGETTGWTGWVGFAAVMMMIVGALNGFQGFIAAVNDEWVIWGNDSSLYLDLSTWGWLHMLLGAVLILSGIGLLSGNVLARTVAVVVATLSLLANFLFLPAYPFWAIIVITLDVVVIWAVLVHGHEMRSS
jgi:hypothetical protein